MVKKTIIMVVVVIVAPVADIVVFFLLFLPFVTLFRILSCKKLFADFIRA